MFQNHRGEVCVDSEALAQKIKGASDAEIEAVDNRRSILRDALNAFQRRLDELPESERKAAISLLYKDMTEIVYDFHLSLEVAASREKIAKAGTRAEKIEALEQFHRLSEDLLALYGVK
jgi:hypothetical protein